MAGGCCGCWRRPGRQAGNHPDSHNPGSRISAWPHFGTRNATPASSLAPPTPIVTYRPTEQTPSSNVTVRYDIGTPQARQAQTPLRKPQGPDTPENSPNQNGVRAWKG